MNRHDSLKISTGYKVIVLTILVLGILVSAREAYAQSSSVTVQYNPGEVSPDPSPIPDGTYQMDVLVGEHGALYDGTAHIQGDQTIYELESGESKTFQLEPDDGYILDRIVFDGQNITSQVEADAFTVTMPDHSTQLEVLFREKPDDDKEPTKEPDDDNPSKENNSGGNKNRYQPSRLASNARTTSTTSSVKTGDTSLWLIWLLLAGVSAIAAWCLLNRRKRQRRS